MQINAHESIVTFLEHFYLDYGGSIYIVDHNSNMSEVAMDTMKNSGNSSQKDKGPPFNSTSDTSLTQPTPSTRSKKDPVSKITVPLTEQPPGQQNAIESEDTAEVQNVSSQGNNEKVSNDIAISSSDSRKVISFQTGNKSSRKSVQVAPKMNVLPFSSANNKTLLPDEKGQSLIRPSSEYEKVTKTQMGCSNLP